MMRRLLSILSLMALTACSNSPELETGEITALKLIKDRLEAPTGDGVYINARKLVSRQMIDAAKVPVLFIEIPRGQNGTMTQYPGVGIGQTWLGADGSTVTLENGMLKATRGMGDDLMGSEISREVNWRKLDNEPYTRRLAYLREDNQTTANSYTCTLTDTKARETFEIFGASFDTRHIQETCEGTADIFVNDYYLDRKGLVRKSRQYHGAGIGYATLERLDR